MHAINTWLVVARCQKQLTIAEQTTLMMDRLPQLSGKATKAKASGVQTVLYMRIHVQQSKAECYLFGLPIDTDTIRVVYRMYTELAFIAYPLLNA